MALEKYGKFSPLHKMSHTVNNVQTQIKQLYHIQSYKHSWQMFKSDLLLQLKTVHQGNTRCDIKKASLLLFYTINILFLYYIDPRVHTIKEKTSTMAPHNEFATREQ